jgi:hypothetical protein
MEIVVKLVSFACGMNYMRLPAKQLIAGLLTILVYSANAQKVIPKKVEIDEAAEFEKVDSFRMLHIVIGGNIYKTETQIKQAYNKEEKKYDFNHELRYIQPVMNLGDITIANLKTSFSGDNTSPYSAPDEFALALKYSGINALMMANSNFANIDKAGLERTQEILKQVDIIHTGVFGNNIQRNGNCPMILFRKGFRIAVLNYAILASRSNASNDFIINAADKNLIELDMRAARMQSADFVIVYFDWGNNMQDIPSYAQQQLARFAFEKGAGLVVGTHPNTVQNMEFLDYYYNGQPQTGLVVYSLGNMIASSEDLKNRNGILLDIEILKNNFTGQVKFGDFGFIPTWNYYDTISKPGQTKVMALPSANVVDGDVFKGIPYIEQRRAANSAFELRKILGTHSDEIQYNLTDRVVNNVDETVHLINASLNNKLSIFRPNFMQSSAEPVAAKRAFNKEETDTFYRVQFYAMKKLIPLDTNYYEHLKGFITVEDEGYYKYFSKGSFNFDTVYNLWLRVFKPRYKQSFIVGFVGNKRVKEFTIDGEKH